MKSNPAVRGGKSVRRPNSGAVVLGGALDEFLRSRADDHCAEKLPSARPCGFEGHKGHAAAQSGGAL